VISRKFYAACNSIYSRTSGLTDLTKLHLMESYCLPLLTYALGSLNLTMCYFFETRCTYAVGVKVF